jgi:pyruvate kinase
MRQTKIIATIGPASRSDEIIEQLIHAGVDICRLNFSHGSHETHGETFRRIRLAAARASKVVSILQDLSGPKIRTGRLKGGHPIDLKDGQTIRIVAGDGEGDVEHIYTTYAELVRKARPGGQLLLDDGKIQLSIEKADGREIVARVLDGGSLSEHKGINAPGVQLSGEALTPKDIEDLKFGARLGVDMVALSFVRSADDMWQARQVLTEMGAPNIPLIAKIERPEALDHLDEILKVSQGVMVARGDLGLEMPLERVPTSQKEITRKARRSGIPVIVATQVLESMRSEPRPTRAEVSDAANAVDDGVDAVMLAGETAVGLYPVKTVETLDAVIREAERIGSVHAVAASAALVPIVEVPRAPHAQALCEAAVTLADHCNAFAIVAITRLGNAARVLSALRPRAPIFAATETEVIARHLTMYRGVVPLTTGIGKDVDTTGTLLKKELSTKGLVPSGSIVVFISANTRLERADQNFVNVQRFE